MNSTGIHPGHDSFDPPTADTTLLQGIRLFSLIPKCCGPARHIPAPESEKTLTSDVGARWFFVKTGLTLAGDEVYLFYCRHGGVSVVLLVNMSNNCAHLIICCLLLF